MAARLAVSSPWLSRYLAMVDLPADVLAAYASICDIKERQARDLKPLLTSAQASGLILDEAMMLQE